MEVINIRNNCILADTHKHQAKSKVWGALQITAAKFRSSFIKHSYKFIQIQLFKGSKNVNTLALKQLPKSKFLWTHWDEMEVKWWSRHLLLVFSVLTGNVTTALSLTFTFHSLFLLQQQIRCWDKNITADEMVLENKPSQPTQQKRTTTKKYIPLLPSQSSINCPIYLNKQQKKILWSPWKHSEVEFSQLLMNQRCLVQWTASCLDYQNTSIFLSLDCNLFSLVKWGQ